MKIIKVKSCYDCLYLSSETQFGKRFCLQSGDDVTEYKQNKSIPRDCPLDDLKDMFLDKKSGGYGY